MKKYKYAIVNDNKVILEGSRCGVGWSSKIIENPIVKINNNLLIIEGGEICYDFLMYEEHDKKKFDKYVPRAISTYKFLWWKITRINSGWVELKERKYIKLTISPFILQEGGDQ